MVIIASGGMRHGRDALDAATGLDEATASLETSDLTSKAIQQTFQKHNHWS